MKLVVLALCLLSGCVATSADKDELKDKQAVKAGISCQNDIKKALLDKEEVVSCTTCCKQNNELSETQKDTCTDRCIRYGDTMQLQCAKSRLQGSNETCNECVNRILDKEQRRETLTGKYTLMCQSHVTATAGTDGLQKGEDCEIVCSTIEDLPKSDNLLSSCQGFCEEYKWHLP